MFLLSLKSLKGKFILLMAVVIAAIIVCAVLSDKEPSSDEPVTDVNAIDYSASTQTEQLEFIAQLGYTVNTEPDSVEEVIIPEEFDDLYTQYNEMQKQADLDLSRYKGCNAKKWTYTVTDYPGYENRDCIKINLLVYSGRIIGGDICSVELDGFMNPLV
ncbi:MAG: DUF4830 domain-containing protein [Clostridia bacterium]|nr:DUF4830 domain-containing protein [Clostridia bacterium]